MLFKELSRVNEIDTTISDLHQHLAELYEERAFLLHPQVKLNTAKKPEPSLPKPSKKDVRACYDELQTAWTALGARFAAFSAIEKKLEKACAIAALLESNNPSLSGQVSIVAVPPHKILENSLDNLSVEQAHRFPADTKSALSNVQKIKSWVLLIVVNPEFSLPIFGMQSFTDRQEYTYNGFDCRGMGLQELIASELQGVRTVCDNSWSVLLKDQQGPAGIMSATLDNNQIIFKTEDADCLLGENYLRLSIAVA